MPPRGAAQGKLPAHWKHNLGAGQKPNEPAPATLARGLCGCGGDTLTNPGSRQSVGSLAQAWSAERAAQMERLATAPRAQGAARACSQRLALAKVTRLFGLFDCLHHVLRHIRPAAQIGVRDARLERRAVLRLGDQLAERRLDAVQRIGIAIFDHIQPHFGH